MSVPNQHTQESQSLNPQDFLDFIEIRMASGAIVRLCEYGEYNWNGMLFEYGYIQITGADERNNGEKIVRPILNFANPEAAFHLPVSQGLLDQAVVSRFRVLPKNLNASPAIFEPRTWRLTRITNMTRQVLSAELRSVSDIQETIMPPRQYLRQDFPSVSLN